MGSDTFPYRVIVDEEKERCTLYLNIDHMLRNITVIESEKTSHFPVVRDFVRSLYQNSEEDEISFLLTPFRGQLCCLFLSLINQFDADFDAKILAEAGHAILNMDLYQAEYWIDQVSLDSAEDGFRNVRALCLLLTGVDPQFVGYPWGVEDWEDDDGDWDDYDPGYEYLYGPVIDDNLPF